jgi:Fe-S-cluster containining protein
VIDCQARIPLCKGRCCKLSFPLTFQDLDEGVVKWEYSRPYQIRKRADAYCVHSDEATRGCQVYDQRPAVCRSYDCRNDRRIWTDFEKRIPAPEEVLDAPPGPAPAP